MRSTDFTYRYEQEPDNPRNPIHSVLISVAQSGYKRKDTGRYTKKSMPPVEFEYSKATIQEDIRELDASSVENLPGSLDGANYRWVDLDGEGVSGILTEQAGAWFYKPNLGDGRFGPVGTVATKPSLAALGSGRQTVCLIHSCGHPVRIRP